MVRLSGETASEYGCWGVSQDPRWCSLGGEGLREAREGRVSGTWPPRSRPPAAHDDELFGKVLFGEWMASN